MDNMESVKREYSKLSWMLRIALILCMAFIAGLLWSCFQKPVNKLMTRIFVGLIIVAGCIVAETAKKRTNYLGDNVISKILQGEFDLISYKPMGYLSDNLVKNQIGIHTQWDSIDGSDLIHGRYRGREFTICNIKLYQNKSTFDGEDFHESSSLVYAGQYLICEMKKNINTRIVVSEKGRRFKNSKADSVKIENADFNKKFNVFAMDEQLALEVLTPYCMEQLIRIGEYAKAHTNFVFCNNNKIYITLQTKRSMFASPLSGGIENVIKNCKADIEYIKKIQDILYENTSLFGED